MGLFVKREYRRRGSGQARALARRLSWKAISSRFQVSKLGYDKWSCRRRSRQLAAWRWANFAGWLGGWCARLLWRTEVVPSLDWTPRRGPRWRGPPRGDRRTIIAFLVGSLFGSGAIWQWRQLQLAAQKHELEELSQTTAWAWLVRLVKDKHFV